MAEGAGHGDADGAGPVDRPERADDPVAVATEKGAGAGAAVTPTTATTTTVTASPSEARAIAGRSARPERIGSSSTRRDTSASTRVAARRAAVVAGTDHPMRAGASQRNTGQW